ncbi:hypothetical protein [Dyella sp. GSA-30]|uniref:hypothetical protein n=1 Tax=Dyella sp. GSA-30 TaxID=2994496 RepID=UPI00248FC485|nr:hypothetical protein [Dyella sp. GSA-30]BDU20277.1 hypothetical protein DYGSA30_17340 [Dyella sp. GSA-30]
MMEATRSLPPFACWRWCMCKVDLFEKQGNDLNLLASPELKSTLDDPAQAQITLPHAADGSSTEFTVGVTRKSGG